MRILFISTLKRKVTAESTASRSQIIFKLASGMAKKGHEVSILGTGDTVIPQVKTISLIEKGWVDQPPAENQFFYETSTLVQLLEKMVSIQDQFDIIHNHLYPEFFTSVVESRLKTPLITTFHSQWTDFLDQTISLFQKTHFISISNAHKNLFKKARFDKVIYNGVDTDFFSFSDKKDDYLLWIGRLSKAKNTDGSYMDPKGIIWAIKLAQATNQRLILTGNVEDPKFFETEVKPHLNDKIQWVGPVSSEQMLDQQQIKELMQKAKAFLMTINWYEPFGLVMAEAGSCGTPVIGFDRGSIPEMVVDGKTGFIVDPEKGVNGLKEALNKISIIKPVDCRQHILDNFSLSKMVDNYEKTYQEIISLNKS